MVVLKKWLVTNKNVSGGTNENVSYDQKKGNYDFNGNAGKLYRNRFIA